MSMTSKLCKLINLLRKESELRFVVANSSGTAFHACLSSTYLFSKIADYYVNTAVASEFNYLEDFLNPKSLITALSQSGETIDVVEPLNTDKKKGSKIVAVVNSFDRRSVTTCVTPMRLKFL